MRVAAAAAILAALAAQLVLSACSLIAAYYINRGEKIELAGDAEGARLSFHRANAVLPIESDRYRLEAAATREAIGPEAAAPIYERALSLAPHSPLLLVSAAENLMALDQTDAAKAMLARAAAITPDDWRTHFMRGLILMKHEKYADAAREFATADAFAYPTEPEVSYQWARALHAQSNDAAALPLAEAAVKARPVSPEYHLLRGKILTAQQGPAAGRRDFGWAVRAFEGRVARGQGAQAALIEAQDLLTQAFFADGRAADGQRLFEQLSGRYSTEQLDALAGRIAAIVAARAKSRGPENARAELSAIIALPNLSPIVRKEAESMLTALPSQ